MEGSSGLFKIEKLSESNYHVWKQKVELILAFRELDDHISDSASPPSVDPEHDSWIRADAKARAVIGLTLSDEHLEHVRDCETAAAMWSVITDLFQRKTLLNKLACRRRFYSAKMAASEKAMAFISRVRQLSADCKAMGVEIDDKDVAMTVLCGLPDKYEHLIVAIDAAANDDTLTMDFVKSRLLQEEQRILEREGVSSGPDAALVNTQQQSVGRGTQAPECEHCGKKGHREPTCWKKYPHLRPKRIRSSQSGLVVNSAATFEKCVDDSESDNVICLVAAHNPDSVKRASSADWIIDSGATTHICNDRQMFVRLGQINPFEIKVGDKSNVRAVGRGDVELMLPAKDNKVKRCKLSDVVYAPTMGYNMLSVRVMSRAGHKIVFEESSCTVQNGGKIIAYGEVRNSLYCLVTSSSSVAMGSPPVVALTADLNLWHRRMAHVHVDGIREIVRRNTVEGVKVDLRQDISRCEACVYGKSTRAPIPQSGGARAANILDLVHTDVCGPFPVASLGNSLYFVSFVDDRSRYAWIYPIQAKSDVFETFKTWLAMVENSASKRLKVLQWSKRLKTLQSDNGGEYLSNAMIRFLEERGIQHRLTTPHNPHQNGVAERMNRTLCELVRTMLNHKKLPKEFWAEALNVAVHVRNRVTTRGLGSHTTPYEVLFDRKPNLAYLRVFGCRCWYNLRKSQVDKLDPRAREAVMIGYARGVRGYKLWDVAECKVVVSRDVQFDEDGQCDVTSEASVDIEDQSDIHAKDDDAGLVPAAGDQAHHDPHDNQGDPTIEHPGPDLPAADTEEDHPHDPDYDPSGMDTDDAGQPAEHTITNEQVPASLRRSTRQRRVPGAWWSSSAALVSTAVANDDPKTFAEAVSCSAGPEWMKSMTAEYDSLMENKCWRLVPRPRDTNVVSCRWVYKTKEEQTKEGTLGSRRKSRLVARGFSQVEGVDYSETYAPVAKLTSIRVILDIVAELDLELHQMDAITAFLNGILKELVYMEQPPGFEVGDPAKVVCLLLKAIYGLKQAPRQWYAKIDDFFLRNLGMERNPADDCVYVRRKGGHILIIALYVDDLLIACSDRSVLMETKEQLSKGFKMKDLGESKIILGMDISRDRHAGTLSLCQSRYAQKVIDRYGLTHAKGMSTPMDPGIDLTESAAPCKQPYREAIGSLMYLMVGTRPDLAFSIGTLAKFVENPSELHWNAVKRVIRYVIHTKELGLVYGGNDLNPPVVYVDADWAGDKSTRRSMSGFVATMNRTAVAWCARQQEVVALSSAESEYISMCNGARETVWLRRLVAGMQVVPHAESPTLVQIDNQAAMDLARNTAVNRRNKHIDVRYHFIRQTVQDRIIEIEYCPTEDMVADMLTKPLSRVKLHRFARLVGLLPSNAASRQ